MLLKKKATDDQKQTLALIAYTVAPMSINTISEMVGSKEDEINRFFLLHQGNTSNKRQ